MKVDERLIQQLAERLRQAVHDTRRIETAQIQIVGLDSVRQRAGALWPELARRVRETSLDIIGQRIGPHDVVIPAGDGFLVVYAEAEGAAGKCDTLQSELDRFYLGQEATRGLSASVQRESLGAAALIERLGHGAPPATMGQAPSAAPADLSPADLPLAVLPVWSVTQQAITGYWITPEHPGRAFARFGYDPAWAETGWHRDDKDFVALDLRILARTVSDIQTGLERGRRCLVGYSVHATTLMNKTGRQAFLQALAATPPEARPLMLGRIAEVQAGTPLAAISEWTHQLRAATPRMAIAIHPNQRDVTGFADLGVFSVACVLPNAHPTTAEVETLTRTITVWSRDLKRQHLKLRLDNLDEPRLLGLVLDGHVDFCTSPHLWPPVPGPEGMKPYSREQFLKSLPATAAERRTA